MTNLSSLPGFSSGGGGGGGGAGSYTGDFFLDQKSFNLQDEGKYLDVTNMDSYFQTFRIRGMDTASEAFMGTNCMVQSGSGGNMQHACTLFAADQATGSISKKQVTVMHNNTGSTSDYSTLVKTADEWTGRYTYSGNIPQNGNSHQQSYHQCYLYNSSGSKSSNHTQSSKFGSGGNDQSHSCYVAPNERRLGGGVRHFLARRYAQSNNYGAVAEFYYDYHSSNINASRTENAGFQASTGSGCDLVTMFHQWDSNNEPYYDAFISTEPGLYAHNRAGDSWTNLGSAYGKSENWYSFTLSNGTMLVGLGSKVWHVSTSGSFTQVPVSEVLAPLTLAVKNWAVNCWNVGEDEWLMSLPGLQFTKFKINPSNGYVTVSNILQVSNMVYSAFDSYFYYTSGLWSSFSPGTVNNGSYMATFGTENSNGYGYGQSKLFYVGGKSSPSEIYCTTYDIAGLLADLSFS